MSTINRLSSVDALQPGDLIPVWDGSNGDTRKASLTTLLAFIESNFADPDYTTRVVAPAASGWNIVVSETGTSSWLIVNPVADYALGSVELPSSASAVNGQEVIFVCTQAVSAFSVTSSGATVVGVPASLAAYSSFRMRYNAVQLTWYTLDNALPPTSAALVNYTPAGTGAVVTTVRDKLRETVSVVDFGADPTGSTPSSAAFQLALSAASHVYVPAGTYTIDATIVITGEKTITGPSGSSSSHQSAVLNFSGTGNVFSASSAEFGGICISNFRIASGGDGSYAIYSTRPQSVFENIQIEGYVGGGIQLDELGTFSQASWGTLIRQVKWIGPAYATPFIGFDITLNGGHCTLDGCEAIRGSIGININQGQAVNIYRCSTNLQCNTATYPYSSLARDLQCGIRLSGSGYKDAIRISECYIEGFTYGIYVEAVNSLTIQDNFIAGLGINSDFVGTAGSEIFLKDDPVPDDNINNVTIQNNKINGKGNDAATVYIGDNATNTLVLNNFINAIGGPPASTALVKGTGTATYVGANTFNLNPTSGIKWSDVNGLLYEMFMSTQAHVFGVRGSTTAGTYEIASQVSNYTLIGRTVTINAKITMAGAVTGGGVGDLTISSLPYPCRAGTLAFGVASMSGVDWTTVGASICCSIDAAVATGLIYFPENNKNAATTYIPISGVTANDVISFSISYEV